MHYPLQAIHDLVYHTLQPSQLMLLKEAALALLWNKANLTVNNLPSDILKEVCSTNNKKEKRVLVHSCQVAAIAMANRLHGYSKTLAHFPLEESMKQEQVTAYNQLRDQLINSLDILEHFPGYLDKDLPLPDHLYETEKENMQAELLRIQTEWKKRIEPALLNILVQPFHDFRVVSSSPNPSYRALDYLYQLAKKTKSLSLACPKDAGTAMIHLLVHLNFNDHHFICYAATKLRPDSLDEGTPGYTQEYTRIANTLKNIWPQPMLALQPAQPSCQSGIITYIQEEIQLLSAPAHKQESSGIPVQTEKKPVKTCLTLSQLAVMLKWCKKTNILTAETMDEMFKLVANNVEMAGKPDYKPSSLQTEYYEMDPAAVSAAKDFIILLLNEARKN